jgi:hypothetical protein
MMLNLILQTAPATPQKVVTAYPPDSQASNVSDYLTHNHQHNQSLDGCCSLHNLLQKYKELLETSTQCSADLLV